ncbi:MAG: hypothetical protein BMS9Abin12_0566 [Acidimicrobiia bacterium]|nr:MAG: hypothetical protein BMS9Abin12_0566 [Acidimicrobiia bacterium]
MSRPPIAIGASGFIAVTFGLIAFAQDSGTIASSAAAMIISGIAGMAIGGLAGLLLVHARWGGWMLGSAVLASIFLASVGGSVLFWIALGIAAISIIGLTGPWLTLWVRQQPVADPLGMIPVALIASSVAAPIIVGLAAYGGVTWFHWTLVGFVVVSAWAYGRGLPFGIWGFRVIVPIVGLFVTILTPGPASLAIAGGAVVVAGMAWNRRARKVTAVITPPLPAPVNRGTSNREN